MKKTKKILISGILSVSLLFASFNSYAGCDAGGVGSTSCTITFTTGAASVEISTTFSVTCGAGYYACCKAGVTGGAKCYTNNVMMSPAGK
ncbi:hypothetical protein DS884_06325 [Tenacibaculum sp. E3R01]|uniref:hypothetical protein n=1 Tax=Tenacibaculum sp. E3R01 TaxID=2267227 RepID=UPI000DE973B3|nr:hypothetical protein [Tenacibaculum sp. E3R01]RBW59350.1 hypothetical protein DS884_06325 [Tenacibaculum sp. E3R01]